MNNKIKTTKTILFTVLIAAMILPFSTMDFAQAEKDNGEKTLNTKKIEQFKEKALQDNEVPHSKLLDRIDDKWISQYDSVEEFERTQSGMKNYVNATHQNNGWNQALVKNHIQIQNFETIIGNIGNGHEIVLLVTEKSKINGQYNPSDPVEKFHKWISIDQQIPKTIEEIDKRLLEIIGDQKFMSLTEKITTYFNKLAEHGSVPTVLFNSDADYWVMVANISMCEYNPKCNAAELTNSLNTEKITPVTSGVWEYILPQASASTSVRYTLTAYVDATGCYYSDCYRSYTVYPHGSGDINQYNFGTHNETQHTAPGKTLTFHASACGYYPGETVTNQVTVTPYLGNVLRPNVSDSDTSEGSCAIAHVSFPVTKDWIYGVKAESTGSFY